MVNHKGKPTMYVLVNVTCHLQIIGPFNSLEEAQEYRRENIEIGSPWIAVVTSKPGKNCLYPSWQALTNYARPECGLPQNY
jgi:hypothetical protein